jgi:hypothetical protein
MTMKTKRRGKLNLNRETLRALQSEALARAVGGTAPSGAVTQCYCPSKACPSAGCAITYDCQPRSATVCPQ